MHRNLLLMSCCAVAPALLAPAPAWAQATLNDAHAADRAALLEGVREINAPGLPGALAVYRPTAFPVVVGKAGRNYAEPVAVAGTLGKGRVFGLGHTGYLSPENLDVADTSRLLLNALRWTSRKTTPRVGLFGYPALRGWLEKHGFEVETLTDADLRGVDVVVGAFAPLSQQVRDAIQAAATRGTGLVCAETGWGWLQLNNGKTLPENGSNRLFAAAGIAWTSGTLERTAPSGYSTAVAAPALLNAATALDALEKGGLTKEQQAQAVWTISQAAQDLPSNDTLLLPRLRKMAAASTVDFTTISLKNPITMDKPLERLAMTLQVREAMRAPVTQVRAHPAATAFPGAVPAAAPRVGREVIIDTNIPEWHSTGLYAAPGEVITVRVPASAAGKGLRVRLGTHKDTLWHLDKWERAPEITRTFALDAEETKAANAFGGAVIIEVPRNARLGTITVSIGGAVPAPLFVKNETSLAEWRQTQRYAPGPWAELVGEKCILTVPSAVVRNLDDPQALMTYWDEVMTECHALYAAPPRPRPERYCVDRQISAGYMHAGYPIMTWEDVAERFVDLAHLRSPEGNVWGFYHEVGHNFQVPDWTFSGTGEVTNNLFSLYGFETLNGKTGIPHPAMEPTQVRERLQKYLAAGAKFDTWKSDPFLALTMYWQLRQGFGWDAYKKVFAEYEKLSPGERPKSDAERRDQWMVRFSRTVGRNLGPFFEAWGVPTSEQARRSLADLPVWMPSDWPTQTAASGSKGR